MVLKEEYDMNKYISYCGLNCETCEARLATVNDDNELRNKVARLWSQLNGAEITPEMINCTGCRIEGVKYPYCDLMCPIRQCASEKSIETCGSCSEMNTCEKLRAITRNVPEALENLKGDKPMKEVVRKLLGKVIVSCQAYEDTPLYGAENMKIMAQSVLMGGAQAIRACWPQDIKAIRSLGDFPIIGINKVMQPGKNDADYIYITPTFESAVEVIEAGLDVLALDCTIRSYRGKEELYALLKQIKDVYPDLAIMADCMTLEDAIYAESTGMVDILSTTLAVLREPLQHPDVEFVRAIKEHCSLPVNAEGAIWDLEDLQAVIDAGADMACIGTAITRPHLITKRFVNYNSKARE